MDGERVVDPKMEFDERCDVPLALLSIEALQQQDVAFGGGAPIAFASRAGVGMSQRGADRRSQRRRVLGRCRPYAVSDLPFLHANARVTA